MYRQESLRLSSGFEPPHLPLALSGRLMGDLCSIVRAAPGDMLHRRHHAPVRCPIASELVCDQPSRFAPLPFQQLPEEPPGSVGVAPSLDQDIDYVAVLIDGAPQIVSLASDADEDLVQEPDVSESALATPYAFARSQDRTSYTTAESSRR